MTDIENNTRTNKRSHFSMTMAYLEIDAIPSKHQATKFNQNSPELDINILKLIENELDNEEKFSTIFLMLDDFSCFEEFINFYHENKLVNTISHFLEKVSNWKDKFIEALCIINNQKIIKSLGLDVKTLELKHCPNSSRIVSDINVGAKILYRFFESLANKQRELLLKIIYKEIKRDKRLENVEILELHALYWIFVKYINILPDGGDMKNLLKCLKSLEHYGRPFYCDIEWYCFNRKSKTILSNKNNDVKRVIEKYTINKGLCLIINEMNFTLYDTEYNNREGSEKDVENLKNTFNGLKFKIEIFTDLTGEEILTTINKRASSNDEHYDCFLICILSHGEPGSIVSVDNKIIPIREIEKNIFTEAMENIPKLLIIQACQGQTYGLHSNLDLTTDGIAYNHKLSYYKEFFMFLATIEDHVAYRHKKEGTWFITDLCHVLQENREIPISIDDWKKEVMLRVQARKGKILQNTCAQLPEAIDRLTKKLYFPYYKKI